MVSGGKKVTTTEAGYGSAWQKACRDARRNYPPVCELCRQPIDLSLPATDRWSWTGGHRKSLARFGRHRPDITWRDVSPQHRSCNSRLGAGPVVVSRRSRRW